MTSQKHEGHFILPSPSSNPDVRCPRFIGHQRKGEAGRREGRREKRKKKEKKRKREKKRKQGRREKKKRTEGLKTVISQKLSQSINLML